MNNYNPGYPPFVLPGGVDLDGVMKLLEYLKTTQPKPNGQGSKSEIKAFFRLWKELKDAEEKKTKEDLEKKKKDDEEKKKKEATAQQLPTFSMFQVLMLLMTFGLPVGAIWLTVLNTAFHTVKEILFK